LNGPPNDVNGVGKWNIDALCERILKQRVMCTQWATCKLEPTIIAFFYRRGGDSNHTLRIEDGDSVGDALPILHEKAKFNTSQEFPPVAKKNTTQNPPRSEKGCHIDDPCANINPAPLYRFRDQVGRQSTINKVNQCP
jgi:hypothetical protein